MRITNFSTVRPQMGSTRTYEDLSKFMGEKPARLGVVSQLYPQYTASYLTEALMNIYTLDKGKKNQFQSINSFLVEWDLNVNFIKRVPFSSTPSGTGAQGADIIFTFPENYYQKQDIMVIEGSRQQVIFLTRPVRRNDREWEIVGKLQDSDYSAELDLDACAPGMTTRFLSNAHPEIHSEGYTKYQSNMEKHRTYITTHRTDIDYSARYRAMEDYYVQIGKGDGKSTDPVFKMNAASKDCLDAFMAARANALLSAKSNVDKNGKPKIFDPVDGQPIVTGDGVIPQIERFAGKLAYAKLTPKVLNTAILSMVSKAENSIGNKFVIVCNTKFWSAVQSTLGGFLRDWKTSATCMYSMGTKDYIKVGGTFDTYVFAGNEITFKVDRALDIEFADKEYAMCLDLTADAASGKPAIAMFTFKNGEFVENYIDGVGGRTGLSGGAVSSPLAASKIIHFGHAGIGVMNPYRSFIMMRNN